MTTRRRIFTLSSFSLRRPARTSGRSSSCYRPLLSPRAAGRPCRASSPPWRISWRWSRSSLATTWSTRASSATQITPSPSSSLSLSRTACGAASPPLPSWRRWCLSGSPPCTPLGRSRQAGTARSLPALLRGSLTAATCKIWTRLPRSALIPLWFSHIRWQRRRSWAQGRCTVRIWGWIHRPTVAAAAAVVTQVSCVCAVP